MVPVSDDAEAFELPRLYVGERTGIGGTLLTKLYRIDIVFVEALLLEYFELDGKPVRVVARHIGGEIAALPFIFHDEVF